jgi:hypothetical protein
MKAVDQIIIRSLKSFLEYINRQRWIGWENEALSLYAFWFLQEECSDRGSPFKPIQIEIKVGTADTPNIGQTL